MIALLTVICAFTTPPSPGTNVDITAKYLHNSGYTYQGTHKYVTGGRIVAEGHPYQVIAKVGSLVVAECRYSGEMIFGDGFESGDTEAWR